MGVCGGAYVGVGVCMGEHNYVGVCVGVCGEHMLMWVCASSHSL